MVNAFNKETDLVGDSSEYCETLFSIDVQIVTPAEVAEVAGEAGAGGGRLPALGGCSGRWAGAWARWRGERSSDGQQQLQHLQQLQH